MFNNILIASNGIKTCVLIDGKLVTNIAKLSFDVESCELPDVKVEVSLTPQTGEQDQVNPLTAISDILEYKLSAER